MSTWWMLIRSSLRHHALSSAVTMLSVALATGLVMAVVAVDAQAYEAFTAGAPGFDAVLGARGSPLQLVLNAVYHLEASPGNLPWSAYQEIKSHAGVAQAVPLAVGDNYQGFQLVGTTAEYFQVTGLTPLPPGRLFAPDQPEAVLGSTAALRTGLRLGDSFHPSHGLGAGEAHQEEYRVVGVLPHSNTPADRALWIPLEGVYRMQGHVLRGNGEEYQAPAQGPIPDRHKEVSAVLLKLASPQLGMQLEQEINRQGRTATLAWPIGRVMAELFERLGWLDRILGLVSWLVVGVACGSILASLYNAILARRRELAILRALGARRSTVLWTVLGESGCLAGLGSLLGLLVYAAIMAVAAQVVRAQTGVHLEVWAFHPILVAAPAGVTALGVLAGLVPAWAAYSTDVAANL